MTAADVAANLFRIVTIGRAIAMKQKKITTRLIRRQDAWRTFKSREEGPSKRYSSGGYRCPGSRKKS